MTSPVQWRSDGVDVSVNNTLGSVTNDTTSFSSNGYVTSTTSLTGNFDSSGVLTVSGGTYLFGYFGLSTSSATQPYSDWTFAIRMPMNGYYMYYYNDTLLETSSVLVNTANTVTLRRTGSTITVRINDTLDYTFGTGSSATLYINASVHGGATYGYNTLTCDFTETGSSATLFPPPPIAWI